MVEEALGVEVERLNCADYTGRTDKRVREKRARDRVSNGGFRARARRSRARLGIPPSGAVKFLCVCVFTALGRTERGRLLAVCTILRIRNR
jgi:hypothetical protein